MARPLRVLVAGGLYHVIVRGNERRDVFWDDADRTRYLSRLAFYREKFSFRVLAYCLIFGFHQPLNETLRRWQEFLRADLPHLNESLSAAALGSIRIE